MVRYVLLIALLGVTACATPYQEIGLLGGVSATQLTHDTFQITARGNGYTDPDTIQRFALRKAAEVTIANGYDYFAVGTDEDRSTSTQVGYQSINLHRGWATGLSTSSNIFKPGKTVLIKAFRGKPPEPTPPGVFDAHELLQYLSTGPYVPLAPSK